MSNGTHEKPASVAPATQTPDAVALHQKTLAGVVIPLDTQIKEVKDEIREIRKDFLVVFGIFASIMTFLSIEVQIFRQAESVWELIGLSAFVLSAILIMVASISFVSRSSNGWREFLKNPMMVGAMAFLAVSVLMLAASHTQTRQEKRYQDDQRSDYWMQRSRN